MNRNGLASLVLILAPAAAGCVTMKTVGVSQEPLEWSHAEDLVCLTAQSGRVGKVARGEVHGHPVVAVEGLAVGYSRTLDAPQTLDGMTVYGAQECMDYDTPLCDHAVVILRGEETYALFWQRMYPTRAGMAASASDVVSMHQRDGLFETIAVIDLDGPTEKAFAAIADARGTKKTFQIATLIAGAAVGAVGHVDVGKGLFEAGTLLSQLPSSEERSLVRARPGLLPVLAVLDKLSADGSQNAAFCAIPRH